MLTLDSPLNEELEHATVVVPTARRAAALRLAYDLACSARKPVWRTPDVMAFTAWLEREAFRAADAGAPLPRPLSAIEEWLLWREAAELGGEPGGAAAGLADSLARAARRMADWGIPRRVLRQAKREECDRLALALEHVEGRCREARATPRHALLSGLEGLPPSDPLVFAGFTERTPARQAWIGAAAQSAANIREHLPEAPGGRILLARAQDPAEELELAAGWCRSHLAIDPSRQLLVVVPDLARRRAQAVRALEQALAPQHVLGGPREEGVLGVEVGEPLGRVPLVRHALTTLAFLTGAIEHSTASAWLRSSFWNLPRIARASLDVWLRRVLSFEVTPRELIIALGAAPTPLAEPARALCAALERALAALADPAATAPIGQWAQRFERALGALGWAHPPGGTGLERRSRARFREVLADLAAIGGRMDAVAAPRALGLLEALLARSTVEPACGQTAVTLSGALADPIVRYDGIWVAGLDAETWPPPLEIDPFIPPAAQRQAGMPGATARGSLARARALLDRWSRSTGELVLSAPERLEDCAALPSALLTELPGAEPWVAGERASSLARLIRSSRRTEPFEDTGGLPWRVSLPIPSGSRALELQSRCPFRAYGELRLGAVPLETPRPGIDPRERGRLLHRALELLWRDLGDSRGLAERTASGQLPRLIERCVARASGEARAGVRARTMRESHTAERLEMRRAARLLADLAALERERSGFRVRDLELTLDASLAGAPLRVRIDRIDELDDGTLLILDYKTGKPSPLDWLSSRPGDPQLLVYLLATGAEAGALAQVQLSARGPLYRGLADRPGRLPRLAGLSADGEAAAGIWRDQVVRWRSLIEGLARDFLAGEAAVDPSPGACRVCHLHTLCRVSEFEAAEERGGLDPEEPR